VGSIPATGSHGDVEQGVQLSQALDRQPWMHDKCWNAAFCFRHPRRQQRQRAIGLPDDEMLGTGMAFGADHGNRLTAPRVKRIDDPNLNRRTPGSMTLLRAGSETPTIHSETATPRTNFSPLP
jgi:hypothetical protein